MILHCSILRCGDCSRRKGPKTQAWQALIIIPVRGSAGSTACWRYIRSESSTGRASSFAHRAALVAAEALVHSAVDVQSKALDLIEKRGDFLNPELLLSLAARLNDLAPSLRGRLAALLPEDGDAHAPQPTQTPPL